MRGLFRLISRALFLAVLAGVAAALLQRMGMLGEMRCGASCQCTYGAQQCDCGHPTCLAPAV